MAVYDDVLNAVCDMAEAGGDLYASIVIGSDPPENGICAIMSGGSPTVVNLDTGMLFRKSILINAKHNDQQTVIEALGKIHERLTKTFSYPETETYRIIRVETETAPTLIGRGENNQWIYGSSVSVSFYWR